MGARFIIDGFTDAGNRILTIDAESDIDEQKLSDELTPIFHRVNPCTDDITGRLVPGKKANEMLQTGPSWLLLKPGKDGFNHLLGIEVHPDLLGALIEALLGAGYETVEGTV